ncbi:MAG: 50S ribosomal protein L25/general stress protein Ctc [Alphaproteobacteria bacterium]|nr:50S ribosomal protein L25/general stress protein Ctc [Alphaproteobacteria bacterium]
MSKNYALDAANRERAGKGIARTLRREGRIPAVIYGDGKEPIKISLDQNTANVEYNRGHMYTTLCDLKIDKDKHVVLARDIQIHPVTDVVEHIDFLRVNKKTKIAVMVPVHFINEDKSPSLDQKGTLNVVRHEVELLCSAMNIPEYIEANVEGKEHGDAVKISDVVLPEGTKPVIDNRDFTIATLVPPKTAEQLEAEEAAMEAEGDGIISDEEAEGEEAKEGDEKASED